MYVAVDIGGTKTLVGLFATDGSIVREERFETPADYEVFMQTLIGTITTVAEGEQIEAIGVGAPGPLDYERQVVMSFGNLPWKDADIKQRLEAALKAPVAIDNDANAAAIYEAREGAGQGYRMVLYITISTGIGTGITLDGSVPPELAKSEGGQMYFRNGQKLEIWEKFASGKAFAQRFGMEGSACEDPEIWQKYAEDLALGFGALLAELQPDVVVVGGGMGEHLAKYHDALVAALTTESSPLIKIPPIVVAKEPEQAVVRGAYLMAKDHASAR